MHWTSAREAEHLRPGCVDYLMMYRPMQSRGGWTDLSRDPRPPPKASPFIPTEGCVARSGPRHRRAQGGSPMRRSIRPARTIFLVRAAIIPRAAEMENAEKHQELAS
jgi:hypothetical protein